MNPDDRHRPEEMAPPALPPEVRRLLLGGLVAFPVLVALLTTMEGLRVWDALLLALILELLPVVTVVQLPLAERLELDRMEIYRGSATATVALGGLALLVGWLGVGWGPMGLLAPPGRDELIWGAGATAAIVALLLVWGAVRRYAGRREEAMVERLMPRSAGERVAFAGVSLSAGVGEELVYRAYAIPTLAGVVGGTLPAALLACGAFGLVHAYQGVGGILRTGFIGGVLAVTFIFSGSIWPPVLAHIAVDLIVGLWLADHLLG